MIPKRLMMLFALLFVVPMIAASCDDEESAGPETGMDVEDIAEGEIEDTEYGVYEDDELGQFKDDTLVGDTVLVSANLSRIVEPGKALAIGADVVDGGLLVLLPPKLTDVPNLEEGMDIQVYGTVIDFAVAYVEDDYDPFDIDDELYVDWEEENAVVARSITRAPAELD